MNLSSTIGSSDIRPRFIMAQQPFTLSIVVIHTWFHLSHWCHASPHVSPTLHKVGLQVNPMSGNLSFFGKVVAAWCVLVINCLLLSFILWISVLCFGRHPRRAITSQQKCQCDACTGTNRSNRHKRIQVLCSTIATPVLGVLGTNQQPAIASGGDARHSTAKPCQIAKSSIHAVACRPSPKRNHRNAFSARGGALWHILACSVAKLRPGFCRLEFLWLIQ